MPIPPVNVREKYAIIAETRDRFAVDAKALLAEAAEMTEWLKLVSDPDERRDLAEARDKAIALAKKAERIRGVNVLKSELTRNGRKVLRAWLEESKALGEALGALADKM